MIFRFIVLLSSLAHIADLTKCLFLNDETCILRPTIMCKENYCWNPSTCIYENSKYLQNIADTTVTQCDEVIIVIV